MKLKEELENLSILDKIMIGFLAFLLTIGSGALAWLAGIFILGCVR